MKRNLSGMLLICLLMAGAIVFHSGVQSAVLSAGERCVRTLVPSLYFFSILAAGCIRSGILEGVSAGRKLCHTDSYLLAVVIFSQLAGYPVGAQMLHTMRTNGTISEASERRMLCVCIGCGPGFLLGTVCGQLPLRAALWMMLSVSLPNILFAFYLARGTELTRTQTKHVSGVMLLTDSVESAASAMLKISGMVMAVAAVLAILEGLTVFCFFGEHTVTLVKSIAEISCITEFMHNSGSLPMAAALLSFGGICVHLQAAAICEGNLPWLRFWLIRILCSAAAYGICSIGMHWMFPDALPVVLTDQTQIPSVYGGSIIPGCCLLVMSVLLLKRQNRLQNFS